jgi:hypothetical protein
MNVYDGERMADLLVADGMTAALGSSPLTCGNWRAYPPMTQAFLKSDVRKPQVLYG